jgi:hypothetical protein
MEGFGFISATVPLLPAPGTTIFIDERIPEPDRFPSQRDDAARQRSSFLHLYRTARFHPLGQRAGGNTGQTQSPLSVPADAHLRGNNIRYGAQVESRYKPLCVNGGYLRASLDTGIREAFALDLARPLHPEPQVHADQSLGRQPVIWP